MSNNSYWHFLVENREMLRRLKVKIVEKEPEEKDENSSRYIIKEDPSILP